MLQARTQPDPRESSAHLTCAVLAALLGDAHESEVALIRARGEGRRDLDFLIEATWAFAFVETGHPARAAVHLARAREARECCDDPADAPILLLLEAQASLAERGAAASRALAIEGQRAVPSGSDHLALRSYAAIVCAGLALDDGDFGAAERNLAIEGMRTGILAARADVLRGRLRFARTADAHASALDLDRAINRLTVIGALRDLALAYIERALQAGIDPGGAPGRWLGRAQSLLANVGGPNDLQALRRAWVALERRLPHSPEPAGTRVVGELRERRDALKDALVRECAPCLETAPCRINTEMEGALGTLSQAEEDLSAALEHSILDRTRMGQLAAATHELASIEEYDAVVGAIARLALVVCPGTAALVVRARPDASLETLAASGTGIARRGDLVAERVREALSTPAAARGGRPPPGGGRPPPAGGPSPPGGCARPSPPPPRRSGSGPEPSRSPSSSSGLPRDASRWSWSGTRRERASASAISSSLPSMPRSLPSRSCGRAPALPCARLPRETPPPSRPSATASSSPNRPGRSAP